MREVLFIGTGVLIELRFELPASFLLSCLQLRIPCVPLRAEVVDGAAAPDTLLSKALGDASRAKDSEGRGCTPSPDSSARTGE